MNTMSRLLSFLRLKRKQILILVVALLGLQWLNVAAGSGKVIDEETGLPLEGAFVVISWKSGGPGIVDGRTFCMGLDVAKTDKEGRYSLPSFSGNFNPFRWERYSAMEVYLAGYESSPNNKPDADVRKLRRFKGSVEARLNVLSGIGYRESCVPENERKAKLAPLYRAQYEEAMRIANSDAEKVHVRTLKYALDSAELPYDDAHRYSDGGLKR